MKIAGERSNTVSIERCSNGWITEEGGIKKIHSDAYSAWMCLGDFLIPSMCAEEILEEILSARHTHLNLKFKEMKISKKEKK